MTDRYTKAIEQLGSDKLDIRLGGIYTLERIARDSARDHPTVMEVLAAFVREHSRDVATGEAKIAPSQAVRLRTDLQAALTVIGRRTVSQDPPGMRINLARADLASARLADAVLAGVIGLPAHLRPGSGPPMRPEGEAASQRQDGPCSSAGRECPICSGRSITPGKA